MYRNPLLIQYGNFVFKYRNKLFPITLVVLLILFPPPEPGEGGNAELVSAISSLVVALAGELLRALTVGLEYIKRGGLNKQVYASTLVTNGLFAHCRNPLYVGNILIALGLLSIADRLALFLIGGALTLVTYVAIVAAEEDFLHRTFGAEFEAYCARVHRWLPDFHGFGTTLKSMRFNWRRVALKESSSFYGWIVAAVLVEGVGIRFSPALMTRPDALLFLGLFAAGTVGFLTVRILKQTRALEA
jgi:protein-S-isoprenylcysteine O-methyltransferase Ste14